jgi:hypothetical protein
LCFSFPAFAGTSIPFTINLSKAVNVTGNPRIAVDVGGVTRYATYTSGTGTSALIFTYAMVAGDVDLDGVTVSSPIDLNGGAIKDLVGNDLYPLTFTLPNTTNVIVNYPSLSMDFIYDADGRYTLNGIVYNDPTSFLSAIGGTFTRASVGTYFDSAGTLQTSSSNAPRFDYDPITHAANGILIEESRTNILPYSNNFSTWTKATGTSSTQNVAGPDGVANSAWTAIISNSGPGLYYDLSTTYLGTTATLSIWLRSSSGTQTVYVHRGNTSTPKLLTVGSSWQRYSATLSNTTNRDYFELRTNGNGSGTGGLSTATLQIYGAQFEIGSFPTSYIPTTGATVTRAADTLNLPIGSWFNYTKGTAFAKYIDPVTAAPANRGLWAFSNGTTSYRIEQFIVNASNNIANRIYNGSTEFAATTSTQGNVGAVNKLGMAWLVGTNTAYGSLNGAIGPIGSPTSLPTTLTNGLNIGRDSSNSTFLNGNIQSIKYYPANITNTQLQLMTQ